MGRDHIGDYRVSSPYRLLFDRVLTKVDPEKAHHAAFAGIRAAGPALGGAARVLPGSAGVRAMGLDFPAVLGLAAGFDKNAVGIDALGALGFGFVEVGTVTGEQQPGNPKPRLVRLPADRAVVNRMGFNNDGAEAVAQRLAARSSSLSRRGAGRAGPVLGINIGKTKVVPEDAAIADYEKSTALLAPYADYLVVNVSSPNTPGLRDLQAVAKLEPLLRAVRVKADEVTADRSRPVPLLVKIAPDLSDDDVLAVADLATAIGLDGIVATNTTIDRSGLASSADAVERAGAGGLSGEPLRKRSLAVLRLLRRQVSSEMTLIGVGGIAGVEDAVERLAAGADLLQGYTAFIYEGPLWPRRINRAIAKEQRR
ncbi:MAG TPA: quinone-dependent dihydroorotate dehydrogenase [Marmoricola sp.]|nr:quinone-dependent dihydroorotate dehydrogenase [Marmoricola sp.]